MRRQAKFYLSDDVIGRVRQESERTTNSMSTVINLLVTRYLPVAERQEPVVATTPEPSENRKQDQGHSYDDVDFDF